MAHRWQVEDVIVARIYRPTSLSPNLLLEHGDHKMMTRIQRIQRTQRRQQRKIQYVSFSPTALCFTMLAFWFSCRHMNADADMSLHEFIAGDFDSFFSNMVIT